MGVALRAARQHVVNFTDESEIVIKNHLEAMECRDCEDILQLGIDAFHWLNRADEYIRGAVYNGMEYDADSDEAIRELFKCWLRPCDPVNKWIDTQIQRGYHPENLDEFRKCEKEVRSIVKSLDADVMTDAMRDLRDRALAEHRDGKTAAMV
jgi:hypothetical protein